jgi:hypothetical protein
LYVNTILSQEHAALRRTEVFKWELPAAISLKEKRKTTQAVKNHNIEKRLHRLNPFPTLSVALVVRKAILILGKKATGRREIKHHKQHIQ